VQEANFSLKVPEHHPQKPEATSKRLTDYQIHLTIHLASLNACQIHGKNAC